MDRSITELFQLGGPVMWPLLLASIVGLAIIIDRVWVFATWHQKLDRLANALCPLVVARDWTKAEQLCQQRGVLWRLAGVYLRHRADAKGIRDDLLRREGLLILAHLERGLRWLAMLAQISTLLGLLGTFHVMIMRFAQGGGGGGPVQPADFSSAIWEALLTTMYGLLIAVPCSATYQVLEGRVDAIARELDILVSCLDEWCRRADAPRPPEGKTPVAGVPAFGRSPRLA
jgi:biopolymer transport protein ExbB